MTQNTLWQPSDINAEGGAEGSGGGEQDSPKRRGRIPQSAWPQILERYRAGATLSAIAREFECTPSAISYIVRKAEASGGTAAGGAETPAETTSEKPVERPAEKPVERPLETAAQPTPAAPAAETQAPRPPRRAPEAPRPAAPAAEAAPKPAEAPRAVETPRPAEAAPKTRLELKPAPAPEPVPAPAPPAAAPAAASEPAAAPAQRPAGAQPTPPVDEVEARLRETARGCLAAYRTWRQQPGQGSIQTLADAVHDLRKALARIEIDMSASRRDEQVARPIPIPAHRAARRPQ